jgi:hypothetical protein
MKPTTQPTDNTRIRCFANYHMTPEEFGVWDVLRSVSHSTGMLYFDGRTIAGYFAGTGKNTIYRIVKSLVKNGWLFVQTKGRSTRNGVFIPTQYQVLSHDEWAEINPGECIEGGPQDARPRIGNGPVPEPENEKAPVPVPGLDQSQNREHPVPEPGPASPETGNGPVPESGMTSPGTGTYIDKENLVSSSSDFRNVAGSPAAPTILMREARQRLENLDGWLAGCVSSILRKKTGTVIAPTKDERQKLSVLVAKQNFANLDVLVGFYHFAERGRSLTGLDYPISLFISQADQWIAYAKENVQKHTQDTAELMWDMVGDYAMPDDQAQEILEPLCELAYLESDLNDETDYDFGIVRTYLNLAYGRAHAEPQAVAGVQQ